MNPETTLRIIGWTFVGAGSVLCGLGAVVLLFAWSSPWALLGVALILLGLAAVARGIRDVTRVVPVASAA
jgi:hypothetical protein